ncbi:MAG: SpoIIE family protein phosphatase, partial [bacterium]|nr:SpoIIE family protein phosphatase [bacterium]
IHGFTTDRTILILAYVLACAGIFLFSFKVAWIAFLTRKEKVRLLIGLLLLFIFLSDNIAQSWGTHSLNRLLLDFSPGLLAIFRVILIYAGMYSAVVFYTTLFNLPTAEVFQRKVSEADSLKELNQLLARLLDFNELAGAITGMTARVLHSSWAWLVTVEPPGFRVEAADNISHDEAGEITRLILEAGVLPEKGVFMLNQKTIENLDLRLNDSTPLKTLAVAPLKADNKITGYLIAGCMEELGFDEDDKQIVQAFAHQAAVGLERAKLLDERLEKEKLEKEMELARDIQQKILPQNIPQVEGFDIAAYFSPAYEVGGDYYDFFPLTSSKLGFVIADVSGKGVSAALIMAEVKGIFESLSSVIDSPSELMSRANEILKSSLDRSRFVTVIYGVVDLVAGTLCFARAGHTPLLLYSAGTGEIRHLQPRGVGLGLLSGQSFPARLEGLEVPVQPGDIIVLYTDGISESKNDSMEDFGQQRLEEGIKINPDRTAAQLVEAINEAVTVFSRHQPQHDDITLIILKIENNR